MKFVVVLSAVLLSFSASAADRDVARAHYLAGQRSYNLGDYRQALAEFRLAYQNSDDPALLFNLGQCFRALGEWQVAARFYRNFLREQRDVDPKTRLDVERIVLEMERAIAEGRQVGPPVGTRAPEEVVSPFKEESPTPSPSLAQTAAQPAARTSRASLRAAGWSLLAGGVVFVVIGATLVGVTVSTPDTLQGARDARSLENTLDASGGGFLGIGGAALVSGAVTLGLGSRR